jgi:hypothetical protein
MLSDAATISAGKTPTAGHCEDVDDQSMALSVDAMMSCDQCQLLDCASDQDLRTTPHTWNVLAKISDG